VQRCDVLDGVVVFDDVVLVYDKDVEVLVV
jgi:hypothetical protein